MERSSLPHHEVMGIFSKGLSDDDFRKLSRLIYDSCGIKMPPHKKSMLEARLRRRLRGLGLRSFEEYCEYLFGHGGLDDELISLIDVVTTNKTDFFRESAHFDYMVQHALPELIEHTGAGFDRPMRIWSAGCSTGEEPYTLAMVLSDFARQHEGFRFSIMATDISTQVLERASKGIYHIEKIHTVPEMMKKRYLMRSRNQDSNQVRIIPELRSLISFRRLNFMEEDFGLRESFDIIFCRNVIIYFDRPTQQALLGRLCDHLNAGCYIFMGHSETLHGMNLPLVQRAPSVYRKK